MTMTMRYGFEPIDLGALNGLIVSHLEAYARRLGCASPVYNMNPAAADVSIVILDGPQQLLRCDVESTDCLVHGVFANGFALALELAALVSESPLSPNNIKIEKILDHRRAKMLSAIRQEREDRSPVHA